LKQQRSRKDIAVEECGCDELGLNGMSEDPFYCLSLGHSKNGMLRGGQISLVEVISTQNAN
jgi:hypothetical protein